MGFAQISCDGLFGFVEYLEFRRFGFEGHGEDLIGLACDKVGLGIEYVEAALDGLVRGGGTEIDRNGDIAVCSS